MMRIGLLLIIPPFLFGCGEFITDPEQALSPAPAVQEQQAPPPAARETEAPQPTPLGGPGAEAQGGSNAPETPPEPPPPDPPPPRGARTLQPAAATRRRRTIGR